MCWKALASRSPLFSASWGLAVPVMTTGATARPFFLATCVTTSQICSSTPPRTPTFRGLGSAENAGPWNIAADASTAPNSVLRTSRVRLTGGVLPCAVRAPRKRVVMMESPLSQCSYERDDSREGPDGHERILR
ncbi:hypothetical protein G6F68_018422 [Rhizopus microsporus]|nr:hypothetical protein G6F68_018422 [Rhizopus microsporus]